MTVPNLTPSTIIVRGTPLAADLGGEVVLMSIEAGKYYGLDAVGTDIWNRIETPTRIDALCADLAAVYDADPAVIDRDVLALLDDLLAQQLIEVKH